MTNRPKMTSRTATTDQNNMTSPATNQGSTTAQKAALHHPTKGTRTTATSRLASGREIRTLISGLIRRMPRGWLRFTVALFLAVFTAMSSIALLGISAWLLSRAAEHPPVMYLTAAAVGVRFFGTGRGVFRYFERLIGHELAFRMQSLLRMDSYSRLANTTLLGRRLGDLLVRLVSDVEAIIDLLVRVILPFLSATVVIFGTALILAMFSPGFAVVLLGTSLISGILVPWLASRWSRAADAAAIPWRGELADSVREMTTNATDLVAYQATESELAEFARIDAELRDAEARGAWTRGVAAGVQLFFTGISVVLGIWIGSHAVADGQMLGRNLAILALVPLAMHEVFADFTRSAQTFTRARAALGRVLDVLTADPIGSGDRVQDPDSTITGLKLNNADIGWPDASPILRDVELSITPGEKVAVIGPSGLGKTTLAVTIMGMIPVVSGEIVAPGVVGYLAQDAHIFATSVAENVRIGNREATDDQVRNAMNRAGLQQMDPERIVGELGATLSGGEAQRIGLARVLVAAQQPGLMILDEPTEHLDPPTASALLDEVFASTGDAAVLVITHDPDLMARCDRIVDLSQWAVRQVR